MCLESSVCVTNMCLPFESVIVINMHAFAYFITLILSNCPTLSMDSPSMCRLGSFSHMLCSGSDAKFRQHLAAVLLIHISAVNREDVYPENNRGGTDEIYASDPEQSIWETNPI